MNKLEIFQEVYGKDYVFTEIELSRLLRVAELIRADEREQCARLAEDGLIGHTIAKAIRARGEK